MKKWIASKLVQAPAAPSVNPIHINHEYLKEIVIKYVSLSLLTYLNFMLFVGGLLIVIVATAHSLDVNGAFAPSSLFWSGVITCATALVIGGFCGWALFNARVEPQQLLMVEPQPQTLTLSSGLLRPFLEGIFTGLTRPRSHAHNEGRGVDPRFSRLNEA